MKAEIRNVTQTYEENVSRARFVQRLGEGTVSKLCHALNEKGCWSRSPDLNRRPVDYESTALPTELLRPIAD